MSTTAVSTCESDCLTEAAATYTTRSSAKRVQSATKCPASYPLADEILDQNPQYLSKGPLHDLTEEKPRYRTSTIARDMFSVNGAFPAAEPGDRSMADHPLMRFERLGSLKPTGRFRGDDGELAKITSTPYNSEESMQERRVAVRCGKAAQETNSGIGSSIIGGQNTD
ncbi:unnamed protein product [Polarella glacialis]|uniref:Uncharacterized protein n=1 Tax=Polarella glacialis TaxID=89957 RepID=A0A813JSH8_POLGL|nr:unnamed protein product [Polarella glacialis]